MQNIDREPLFCTQFAKQKVCQILYFYMFWRLLRQYINQIRGNIHQISSISLNIVVSIN